MNLTYWIFYLFFQLMFYFFRGKVNGRENLPKSDPFILASNHISYFDPPLVATFTSREMFFFAKKELFKNRIIGALLSKVNARPVRRGAFDRGGIETAVQLLDRGKGLVIFPEGTRSLTDDFLPTKPGVGMIACQAKVSIVPVFIHGSNALWKCFLGAAKLRITYGEPLSKNYIVSLEAGKKSYLVITEEIMKRIRVLKRKTLSAI